MRGKIRKRISLFLVSVIILSSLGIAQNKPVGAQTAATAATIIEHDTSKVNIPEYSETPTTVWSDSGINGYGEGLATGSRATAIPSDSLNNGLPNRHVKWTPSLAAGTYKVSIWKTVRPQGQDPSVGVWVMHSGETEKLTMSQTGTAGWVELGTYSFKGDGTEGVLLYRTTPLGSKDSNGNTIFTHADSVMFEQVETQSGNNIFITPEKFTSLGTWSYDVAQGYNSVCLIGLKDEVSETEPAEVNFTVESPAQYRIWFHTRDYSASPGVRFFEAEVNGQRLSKVFGQHGQNGWKWEDGGIVDLQSGQSNITVIDTSRFYARFDGVFITSDTSLIPPEGYGELVSISNYDNGAPDDSLLAYPEWAKTQADPIQQQEIKNSHTKVEFKKVSTNNGYVIKKQMFVNKDNTWIPVEEQNNQFGYLLMYAKSSQTVGVRADGVTQVQNLFPLWINAYDNEGVEKRVMTQDIYRSAMPSWLIPSSIEVIDEQTVRLEAENEYAHLTVTWTLPEGSDDPIVTCNLQARQDGNFSLGILNGTEQALSDVKFLFDPIRITQSGFPDKSYLVTEQYSTAATSFMTLSEAASPVEGSQITYGIAVDPSSIPNRWAKQEYSKFGLAIRGINGGVQPALFAPLFGTSDSSLAKDELYEISYRPIVREGEWYDAYSHIVTDIYGLEDYRKNYNASFTDTIFNVQDLLMDDTHGGWDPVSKAHYNVEGKNIVSQADNLTYLQSYLLTEDEDIYEKRTIPSLEYLLTRGTFHFSSKPKSERTGNSVWMKQVDEYPIGDPVKEFGTSVFGGAYEMTNKLLPALREIGTDNGVRVLGGATPLFAEYTWLYNFTGNQDYLARAKEEADKYLAGDYTRLKKEVIMGGFINYKYTPYLPGLLDLYEASGEQKYLDAAAETARWLMTLIWTQPSIPQGDITLDADKIIEESYQENTIFGWRGDVQDIVGIPDNLDKIQNETVPAWVTSRVGLTIEDISTYNATASGNIFMTNWAPDMLRLAKYTGDELFETTARNAVIGRAANYPGYYVNDFMVHNMTEDYPYEGPDITHSIYYHHMPTYLAMLEDFIITQAWNWSDGKIEFPSVRQQGYVWFYNKHYGFEAGKFFDEDGMWLWLKEGLVKPDNLQIDWIAARKDGKVGIALMNEASNEITTTIDLGNDITGGENFNGTATVYDESGAKTTVAVTDSKLTVTIPGHKLMGIMLEAEKVIAPKYAEVDTDNLTTATVGQTVVKPQSETDFGTGMVLQIDPSSYYAYVYTTQKPAQIQKAILHYQIGDGEWQQLENATYPFEFTVKVENPTHSFNFYLEVIDTNNTVQISQQKVLNALRADYKAPEYKLTVDGNVLEEGGSFEDHQLLTLKVWDNVSEVASAQITVSDSVYAVVPQGQSYVNIDLAGKVGSYTATIIAEDFAGNRLEKSYSFTVTTSLSSMQQLIDGYTETGELGKPLAAQLTNNLNQAQQQLDNGNTGQAIKHMEDFIKHLNNEAMTENITDNIRTILKGDAEKIIQMWSGEIQ